MILAWASPFNSSLGIDLPYYKLNDQVQFFLIVDFFKNKYLQPGWS